MKSLLMILVIFFPLLSLSTFARSALSAKAVSASRSEDPCLVYGCDDDSGTLRQSTEGTSGSFDGVMEEGEAYDEDGGYSNVVVQDRGDVMLYMQTVREALDDNETCYNTTTSIVDKKTRRLLSSSKDQNCNNF